MEKNYHCEEIVTVIDRERYVREFRDVETFDACCQQCPNYGRRWGCPPFDHNTLNDLLPFEKVMIIGLKLTPQDSKMPIDAVYDLMRPELNRLNKRLLDLEKQSAGMAFGFVGKCPHCPGMTCARIGGEPCRHPELVRPSLEAYGFNVAKTASDVLHIDMQWSNDGKMPRYLTLVCGLFFNGPDLQW